MRFFLTALFIHIFVFSFVWVGFSVPKGVEQNSITYLGDMASAIENSSHANDVSQVFKASDAKMIEDSSSAFFTPWLQMRQVEKPR